MSSPSSQYLTVPPDSRRKRQTSSPSPGSRGDRYKRRRSRSEVSSLKSSASAPTSRAPTPTVKDKNIFLVSFNSISLIAANGVEAEHSAPCHFFESFIHSTAESFPPDGIESKIATQIQAVLDNFERSLSHQLDEHLSARWNSARDEPEGNKAFEIYDTATSLEEALSRALRSIPDTGEYQIVCSLERPGDGYFPVPWSGDETSAPTFDVAIPLEPGPVSTDGASPVVFGPSVSTRVPTGTFISDIFTFPDELKTEGEWTLGDRVMRVQWPTVTDEAVVDEAIQQAATELRRADLSAVYDLYRRSLHSDLDSDHPVVELLSIQTSRLAMTDFLQKARNHAHKPMDFLDEPGNRFKVQFTDRDQDTEGFKRMSIGSDQLSISSAEN